MLMLSPAGLWWKVSVRVSPPADAFCRDTFAANSKNPAAPTRALTRATELSNRLRRAALNGTLNFPAIDGPQTHRDDSARTPRSVRVKPSRVWLTGSKSRYPPGEGILTS